MDAMSLFGECERRGVEVENLKRHNAELQVKTQDADSRILQLNERLSKAAHDISKYTAVREENDTLAYSLRELQGKYRALEDIHRKVAREGAQRGNRISSLNHDLGAVKMDRDSLKQSLQEEERTNRDLRSELEVEKSKNAELEARHKASQVCVRQLEDEVELAKAVQQRHVEDVRKAQETVSQLMEQGQWMPEEDREVSRKLNTLYTSMINWSKVHAHKTAAALDGLPAIDQTRIRRVLSQVTQRADGKGHMELRDLGLGNKSPAILLTAALSHAIYTTVFNNPFFFESAGLFLDGRQPNAQATSAILYRIYTEMQKNDKKGANSWRSQTLRMFASQNPSNEEGADIRDLKTQVAEQFSRDFIRGDARVFLDVGDGEGSDRREDELISITSRAAEWSYKLWAQRAELSSWSIKELPKVGGVVRFNSNDRYMEHHPLHNLQLDDDESCLDGKSVGLVTHPAVVAYEDSEGDEPSVRKVWKKAIVWMGTQ
ncbi:hypothetical protein GP486_002913 [Trichoglossum hirsutum]|uniref:Uncharacterized protein n=1 Tax=Trichoglossum hirsutum TaxID=265104 RepID=A0A9P8LE46_9PEZI|nr:hypothetical protein GP486_002913 [Trichoglossum hirsutum]